MPTPIFLCYRSASASLIVIIYKETLFKFCAGFEEHLCLSLAFIIIIIMIIIIITLFQEDNILDTIASLTYGPQIQSIITKQWKVFTVCIELVRAPYIEHAASGIPNCTRL